MSGLLERTTVGGFGGTWCLQHENKANAAIQQIRFNKFLWRGIKFINFSRMSAHEFYGLLVEEQIRIAHPHAAW